MTGVKRFREVESVGWVVKESGLVEMCEVLDVTISCYRALSPERKRLIDAQLLMQIQSIQSVNPNLSAVAH